ncbi:MAG: hypothetical protein ABJA82_13455 [Myxococcales bacterium]
MMPSSLSVPMAALNRRVAWIARNRVQLAIIALGIALRWSMRTNFDYRWSYDFEDHLRFINWVATHFTLPDLNYTREAYHPPLYYFIVGTIRRLGAADSDLGTLSIVCGSLRLFVLWAVFARWMGRASLATGVALLVAAIQPTSIHLDGMASGEGLSNLEAALAIWMVPPLFLNDPRSTASTATLPWGRALAFGVLLGLALLTKVSALAIIAALGIALVVRAGWLFRALWGTGDPAAWNALRKLFLVWLVVALAAASVAGWYCARNQRLHGKLFLSGFDGPDSELMQPLVKVPLLARRPARYYVCWSSDIYRYPYYPSGVVPTSCFWPQLVASSWVDFYRYGFSNGRGEGALRTPIRQTAIASVIGGTVLGVCAAATTMVLLLWSWRRRQAAPLALLLMPVIALFGQMYFATAFPIDGQGMVKGLYMQFASPPLYATIGIAVAYLAASRPDRPLGVANEGREVGRQGVKVPVCSLPVYGDRLLGLATGREGVQVPVWSLPVCGARLLALVLVAALALVGSYAVSCRFLPAPIVKPGGPAAVTAPILDLTIRPCTPA